MRLFVWRILCKHCNKWWVRHWYMWNNLSSLALKYQKWRSLDYYSLHRSVQLLTHNSDLTSPRGSRVWCPPRGSFRVCHLSQNFLPENHRHHLTLGSGSGLSPGPSNAGEDTGSLLRLAPWPREKSADHLSTHRGSTALGGVFKTFSDVRSDGLIWWGIVALRKVTLGRSKKIDQNSLKFGRKDAIWGAKLP